MDAIRHGSDITLPEELVFIILDIAAALKPHTASRFRLLSRAACLWFEPFVYHTIILRSPAQIDQFKTTVRQRRLRDPEFFHRNVRVIIFRPPRGGAYDGTVKHILTACNNVVHVSCTSETMAQALPAGALLSLRSLNMQGSQIPSSATITHLVLGKHFTPPDYTQSIMDDLALRLPNLTHLCLDVKLFHLYRDAAKYVFSVILSTLPPRIQRLVIVLQFAYEWSMAQRRKLDAAIRSRAVGEGRTIPICFMVIPPGVDEDTSSLQDIPSRDVAAVLGWDVSFAGNIWERAEEVLSSRTE